MNLELPRPIGLALGSGAARGWSHIGVIRALIDAGIEPDIVCGASAGAVVGAAYAANRLDSFESWVRALDRRKIMAYLDPTMRGGLLKSRKVFDAMREHLPDGPIESLPRPFGAVATDLSNGHEVWLRKGSLICALRASVALPGLVKPEYLQQRWLVDGGLVNPVPVTLCRAMGAASVIAVDLNTTLLRPMRGDVEPEKPGAGAVPEAKGEPQEETNEVANEDVKQEGEPPNSDDVEESNTAESEGSFLSSARASRLLSSFQEAAAELLDQFGFDEPADPAGPNIPSIYDVITNSINIMQTRIGRSRLAGDPPELLITPRLQDFALLDFDRGDEAILIGRRAVAHALAAR